MHELYVCIYVCMYPFTYVFIFVGRSVGRWVGRCWGRLLSPGGFVAHRGGSYIEASDGASIHRCRPGNVGSPKSIR